MSRARASRSDGSVFFRQDRQRWVAMIDLGYVGGRRSRKTATFLTKTEAVRWKNRVLAEVAQGLPSAPANTTVAAVLNGWLSEDIDSSDRAALTKQTYRSLVTNHVVPALGRKRLAELTQRDVSRLLSSVAQTHSQSTVHQIKVVLTAALRWAMRNDLAARNVATLVEEPRAVKPTKVVRPLSRDEQVALLETARDHPLLPCIWLMIGVGLRRGEAVGLQWRDFDETAGTLKVQRQVVRGPAGAGLLAVPPKANSVRTIALPRGLLQTLLEHRAEEMATEHGCGPRDWIFPGKAGGMRDPSNVSRVASRLFAQAGVAPGDSTSCGTRQAPWLTKSG